MPTIYGWTMNSRSVAVFLIAVVSVVFAQYGAAQGQERYKARLATVPMDGGMRETVAGTGAATAVLAGTKLTINGTFEGLRSPATAARLHGGLTKGVRGAALGDLTVSKAMSGTITGSVDLTPEQVQGLKNGRLYLQISSEKAPEGNLWGWLLR
jgi:CHRD domain